MTQDLHWAVVLTIVAMCLDRLKAATLNEQEEEEEALRWRVEAELKLALDAAAARHQQESAELKVGARLL